MTNSAAAAFERMTDVELNEAFARVARAHPGEWDHPRRAAIRAEMVRRAGQRS